MTFRQIFRVAALLGFALAMATAAADPISIGFRVTPMSGPLAGTTSNGSFTYDTSIVPVGGGTVAATGLLSDLVFTFNGIAFDETTVNTGSLTFDPTGQLVFALFGTNCGAGFCNLTPGTNDFLAAPALSFPGLFAYTTPATQMIFSGEAFLFARLPLPEPSTLPLLVIGLAAAGVVLRRRAHRTSR